MSNKNWRDFCSEFVLPLAATFGFALAFFGAMPWVVMYAIWGWQNFRL